MNRGVFLFDALLESSNECISIINNQGEIIKTNNKFKDVFGASKDLSGLDLLDWFSFVDSKDEEELVSKPLDGELIETSRQVKTNDGRILDVKVLGYPLKLKGEIVGAFEIYKPLDYNSTGHEKTYDDYNRIFNSVECIIGVLNSDGEILTINNSFKRFTGFNLDKVKGKDLFHYFHERDWKKLNSKFDEAVKDGNTTKKEVANLKCSNGSYKKVLTTFKALKKDGSGQKVLVTVKDVPKLKQEIQNLDKRNKILELAFEIGNIGIWEWDLENEKNYYDENWAQMLGYEKEELENTQRQWKNLIHPEDKEKVLKKLRRHFKGEEKLFKAEYRLKTKYGNWKWILTRGKVIQRNENNDPERLIGVHQNIHNKKKTEIELKEKEKRYRTITENTEDMISIINSDYEPKFIKESHKRILGYEGKNLIEENVLNYIHPKDQEKVKKKLDRILNNGKENVTIQFRFKGKEGNYRWLESALRRLNHESNEILAVTRDITQRKETQEELKQKKKRLNKIFDSSPNAITIMDLEGNVIDCNQATLDMHGFESKDEIIGENPIDHVPDGEEKEKIKKDIKRCIEEDGIENIEYTFKRQDGSEFPALVSVSVLKDSNGEPSKFITVKRDISERKKLQEELKENKERFELALKGANLGLWDWNMKTNEALYDERWAEMLGYNPEEINNTYEQFKELLHPEDHKKLSKIRKKHGKGEIPYFEAEFRMKSKSGNWRWILSRGKIVERENGKPKRMIGIHRDITEKKKAEEREKFLHSMLRHDLKNRFEIEEGYLDLISETVLTKQQKKLVNKLERVNKRNRKMVKKIRTLKKIENFEKSKEINLDKVVKEVIEETKNLAKENNIDIKYEGEKTKLIGNNLIKELFSNLILNGINHSDGDQIKVKLQRTDNIKIIVEDDGGGIPDYLKDDIFKKGSKRGDNAGSGLGLYIVKRITEIYNGEIEVKDSDMGGARFEVELTPKPKKENNLTNNKPL